MTNVLIAGCGYLGTTVGLLLAELGHQVWGLRRDPSGLPKAIAPLAADLTRPESLVLPRVQWVVYAAGATGRSDDAYRAAYPEGLSHLLEALADTPPERLLFTSSTAVYGQDQGEIVDEESPTEPADFPGRRLLEAEARVSEFGPGGIVLRLGGLYGPGRTRLIESVLNGESDYPSGPPRYTNRIHRDDAALAIAHLLELSDNYPVYCGVDREPASQAEVLTWLADRLDVPRPRAVAGVAPSTRGNKRVSSARLAESGFDFRYPSYREGYGALIEGLGESIWSPGEARS